MGLLPEPVEDAICSLYPNLVASQALVCIGFALSLRKGSQLDLKCFRTRSKQHFVIPETVAAGDQNTSVGKKVMQLLYSLGGREMGLKERAELVQSIKYWANRSAREKHVDLVCCQNSLWVEHLDRSQENVSQGEVLCLNKRSPLRPIDQ